MYTRTKEIREKNSKSAKLHWAKNRDKLMKVRKKIDKSKLDNLQLLPWKTNLLKG